MENENHQYMRVKIIDLYPNPFRDLKNYPIDRKKIEILKDSIDDTGFWDNILAREHKGKIQIAYGHHRLIALQELYKDKPDKSVNIPVKDLSDALMIKIMANENMEDWRSTPAIIDETVKVVKEFLESRPNEIKKVVPTGTTTGKAGGDVIAIFLNWKKHRHLIYQALHRLSLADKDVIDLKATNQAPTSHAAATIAKQFNDVKLPLEKQEGAIKKIAQSKNYSEENIRNTILEEKYGNRPLPKKHLETDFKRFVDDAYGNAAKLLIALEKLIKLKKELHESLAPTTELVALELVLEQVAKQITNLKNTSSNGSINTKPNIKLIAGK